MTLTQTTSIASIDASRATFTLRVLASNSAPQVAVTGVEQDGEYEFGSVPIAGCAITDAEDGNSTFAASLSSFDGPRSADGLGSRTASCTYTDAGGLSTSVSATNAVVDTTGPVVSVPTDVIVEATGPSGAAVNYGAASASDLVDGTVEATCVPASGTTFALGLTTVVCSATDLAGNPGSDTFSVTVRDMTAPVVTVPANMVVAAEDASGAIATFSASAADLVDGSITPSCVPASGTRFALGVTTVECSATDVAGNLGSASFTVTVQDQTAPVVTVPANMTVEATSSTGASVLFDAPTAEDNAGGVLVPTCDAQSGDTFPLGDTTVTCTATDQVDNEGTNTFSITVEDTTAPTITVPNDITRWATSAQGTAIGWTGVSATDVVDGLVSATCDHPSGSSFGLGTTTVTCGASDAAGNSGSKTFTVTVTMQWSGSPGSPIKGDGSSVFKNGSTVPVKVKLTGASGGITDR